MPTREIEKALHAGDLLCIFPEGALTRDGELAQFRKGIERIVQTSPVPVVPMALRGLWGSYFSHAGGVFKNPSRLWSRVTVAADTPLAASQVNADALHAQVLALRGNSR